MAPAPDPAPTALLTAPLLAPAPGWTSRSVAAQLGTSQSAVARAWTAAYRSGETDGLLAGVPPSGLRLEAVTVSAQGSRLVLVHERDPLPGAPALPPGPFMRSARRPPLQALLAADLLLRGVLGGIDEIVPPEVGAGDRKARYVLRRAAGPDVASDGPRPAVGVEVVVQDPMRWQALLEPLVRRADATPLPDLLDLQHRLMAWARGERPSFSWAAGPRAPTPARRPAAAAPPPSTSQAVADDVVQVLLRRIDEGRLSGGDRVTEADLARAVRTSRGHVRDAVRVLAAAGLVDLEPGRGAVVPTPTVADVVETYAARRALGTVVVRYAVRSPAEDLAPAADALRAMLEVAGTGDAHATGEADLRFQDALAGSSGLRRVPQLFWSLTAQLRLSIALMGLDYSYSIPGMCQDDEVLMARILARDERGAVAVWQSKIDDALSYMTTQLGRWSRHQPRARHSASAGRSRPSVVSSPWPG